MHALPCIRKESPSNPPTDAYRNLDMTIFSLTNCHSEPARNLILTYRSGMAYLPNARRFAVRPAGITMKIRQDEIPRRLGMTIRKAEDCRIIVGSNFRCVSVGGSPIPQWINSRGGFFAAAGGCRLAGGRSNALAVRGLSQVANLVVDFGVAPARIRQNAGERFLGCLQPGEGRLHGLSRLGVRLLIELRLFRMFEKVTGQLAELIRGEGLRQFTGVGGNCFSSRHIIGSFFVPGIQ
jgi:hypothetical protein